MLPSTTPTVPLRTLFTVLIIGGGSAGIATAASLKRREPSLDIAIVDPAETHYYQPGWTLAGGGCMDVTSTLRTMASVIPPGVTWIKEAVTALKPELNCVKLSNGQVVSYRQLVVAPGLKLDWAAVPGLEATLGANGVTSNYRYDLAPYTWHLVQSMHHGRALFSQPPLPIKCAGAPQKALYLACDYWRKQGKARAVSSSFYHAGSTLFGVPAYIPALTHYIDKYDVDLQFQHRLVAVDGQARIATFERTLADGSVDFITEPFDMLHVVPPQVAPDFIRHSALSDSSGWLDVDPATLASRSYSNVHGLGDVINTTNAKTMAAARKQAPIVANNVLVALNLRTQVAHYDGYGSCPLTVEKGKIVLAEFTYGGKLAPSFAPWIINGRKPSRLAWHLKRRILPQLYWHAMLKGREWLVKPHLVD